MVTYNRTTWVDGSTGGTPITAARLNNMETALTTIAPLVGTTGSGTGNVVTLVETANGYPVTTPAANTFYRFVGLATPPFQRAGDTWDAVDLGFAATWTEIFTDDFNDAVGTGANVDVPTTEYGGDTTLFYQRTDGLLVPRNFSSTGPTQYVLIPKVAGTTKQAVEISAINLSSNTSNIGPHIYLNVTANTMTGANITAYRLRVVVANSTATWSCTRVDAGTVTTIGTAFTEPDANIARPFTFRAETDGLGTITYLRGDTPLASWTDPATTKLTGVYAGIGANNTTSSTAASMNVKMDQLHVYKR